MQMNRKKVAAQYARVTTQINAAKRAVAKDIAKILEDRKLTQTDAAFLMKDAPSQVSLVVTGKLRGFSMERLIRMRAMLGAKVRIAVSDGAAPEVAAVLP
jgi:predicted XRE-type DNA-binding protein